jgi:ribonuclease HI
MDCFVATSNRRYSLFLLAPGHRAIEHLERNQFLNLKDVTIFTDGGARGNPGPGGYAAILVHKDVKKEIFGGYRLTTNNRMELMAAIKALAALKTPCRVKITSDSKYVVEAMTKGSAERWRRSGWRLNKKTPAKNPDLWEELLTLCSHHEVQFLWVKGHAGHAENERCDVLAVAAAKGADLPPDAYFEALQKKPDLFG